MLKSGRLTVGVVSLHRSHYLKSSALKQKVRDQQILTSGQAYDSILMQFSNSSSLIITLLPANLISHLSNFRHIPSASNFAKLRHWQSIPRAAFPKQFFSSLLFSCSRWHAHSGQRLYVWKADPFFFFFCFMREICSHLHLGQNIFGNQWSTLQEILCSWLLCVSLFAILNVFYFSPPKNH